MTTAFQQQRDDKIFQDDEGISVARHCLLQKEVADVLTEDMIFFLFATEEGRNLMVMDELPIHHVIELGFHDGEELIGILWHYASGFDPIKQDEAMAQYQHHTLRICSAILSHEDTVSQAKERACAHTSFTHKTTEHQPSLLEEQLQELTDFPLRTHVTIQDLLDEYHIPLHLLLQENEITLEAICIHNGFAYSLKAPLDALYIFDLDELYAIQKKLENNIQPDSTRIQLYINEALSYFHSKCYKETIKYQRQRCLATKPIDQQNLTQLGSALQYARTQCSHAWKKIDYTMAQLSPELRIILIQAFQWSDHRSTINWELIISPSDYQPLLQTFADQFIQYLSQALQMNIPPYIIFAPEATQKKTVILDTLPGKVVMIEADGNCFFHAVAHELARQKLSHSTHMELREQSVQYLKNNPEILQIYPYENELPEAYITRMSHSGVFAEGPIIEVTAMALNIQIEIFQVNIHRDGRESSSHFSINDGPDRRGMITIIRLEEEGEQEKQHYLALERPIEVKNEEPIQLRSTAPLLRPEYFLTQSFFFNKLRDKQYLIEHRHDNPTIQHAYDEQYGLVITRPSNV